MIFTPKGRYAHVSACGRYTVAAYKNPLTKEWIYQAFRVLDKAVIRTGNADQCREACREDSQVAR